MTRPQPDTASRPTGRDTPHFFARGTMFLSISRIAAAICDPTARRASAQRAADMFVFLSGMAASCFGEYLRRRRVMGTARIVHRCWKLLSPSRPVLHGRDGRHLGTRWFGDTDMSRVLSLNASSPIRRLLLGLFTLTYVPHCFDILPSHHRSRDGAGGHLLARVHPLLVPAVSVVPRRRRRARAQLSDPPTRQAVWYFHPLRLAAHLLYRVLPRPRLDRRRSPKPAALGQHPKSSSPGSHLTCRPFHHIMWIDMLRIWIMEHSDKTNLDLLQYVHFLARPMSPWLFSKVARQSRSPQR
jgi:hypothetical protein